MKTFVMILALVLAVLLVVLVGMLLIENLTAGAAAPPGESAAPVPTQTVPPASEAPVPVQTEPVPTATEAPEEETAPPPEEPAFAPAYTADSDPANWDMEWHIFRGTELLDSFTREEPIVFENGNDFQLPGVAGFRGGNYRTDGSYGTAQITSGSIQELWSMKVGFLDTAEWIGCGWTGQPLAVQWDAETRSVMNLYEEKKSKDGLVEAIYAKMDGYVHFIDMEDGSFTRDPLFIGRVFKGSGALDPRGYPILYLGVGLQRERTVQSIMAISLIDGSILFERSGNDRQAPRYWFGFDSCPLVDPETDTLIWAGESGLVYTIKLNTYYDPATGTLTMEPETPVMTAYNSNYGRRGRYLGYEASITAADQYLYLADNSGMLQCVNINTLELIWAQDLKDDINATPAFEWASEDQGYLYAAPSVDYAKGKISLYKLDARTGQIVWSYSLTCGSDDTAPGGVLASPLLGRQGTDMEDTVIFSVGRSPNNWNGQIIAFDKQTGEILWQYETGSYIWSSPVGIYTDDGTGYVLQIDAAGTCYLLKGTTGEVLDTLKLKRTVESSPVVFGNKVLIGTRAKIHLLEIQ